MRKIIVHEFITLDGVIQAPGSPTEDTDGGFTHGGWTLPYWHDDIGAHFGQIFADADTLLLGRKTWQTHGEAFEPDPANDPFNGFKKYVVSNTLKSADGWRDSTIISGNVIEEISKLKSQPGKNIVMDGSSVLMHTLIENDLVDEYALHVYPLVLGIGKRLFPDGKRVNLKLIESSTLPTGVMYQRYQPA
ncbi:MAG: deaminase [Anaerolineales bacterium]|nr:dihydrofolate reductase [Anaerolineae bacterium]PWB69012.1 MAG: deaminase [Anaerolineales bacterium]